MAMHSLAQAHVRLIRHTLNSSVGTPVLEGIDVCKLAQVPNGTIIAHAHLLELIA